MMFMGKQIPPEKHLYQILILFALFSLGLPPRFADADITTGLVEGGRPDRRSDRSDLPRDDLIDGALQAWYALPSS